MGEQIETYETELESYTKEEGIDFKSMSMGFKQDIDW